MASSPSACGRILIVEDDQAMRASCRQALQQAGYEVLEAAAPTTAYALLCREEIDLVVTDLRMPEGGGQRVLADTREVSPDTPVILITAFPSVESAVEAFKSGVLDYLPKPFTGEELIEAVQAALSVGRARDRAALLRRMGPAGAQAAGAIGSSPAFLAMLAEARRVAALDGSVVVTGETGSGKELVARAIHQSSTRANGPFVAVNCAAIAENLLESELFGYERGAFTGAAAAKPGLIEHADLGTLFLDELGDLASSAQAKLLRALEERAVRRVGGLALIPVDFRIVAATNRDLRAEVRAGRFREDIYYHNVVQKVLARATGPLITADDLRRAGLQPEPVRAVSAGVSARDEAVTSFERHYVEEALRQHHGNITHAARALGIHRATLHRLIKKLGVATDSAS
ncbi:MAG: sigma-54-dependent Fis family transcriptional regulator [Candidatus Schekmanbacteria bacterium]|nr:sigma-54-dependent Fis family transcriptional regulator [Candidatus Schekmanbacteria bacterium]